MRREADRVEGISAFRLRGFTRVYRLTFYAALAALAIGVFLPGWPRPWVGRAGLGAPDHDHVSPSRRT